MWYPRLYRTALRMTGSRDDSADLTQQAFCKAFVAWDRFDGRCQPVTWLHSILANCIRDWLRKRSRRAGETCAEWDLPAPAGDGTSAIAHLDRQERLASLRESIDRLSADLRTAFVAAVIDGYTYQEIAEMLSLPVGTVGYRVYKARREVTGVMQDLFPET